MAVATYTGTTSGSGVNKLYRKLQAPIGQAFNFECEEFGWYDSLPLLGLDVSAREMTVPLDVTEGGLIASIPEFGDEAIPYTPNLEEITVPLVQFNGRFTASVQAQIFDQRHRAAQLQRQIVYQGKKIMQSMARHWSDYSWGFATGYLAKTSTAATQSSGTYTLTAGYGITGITNAAFLAGKFKKFDRVALIRSGAIVANSVAGQVTAVSASAGTIDVTWQGSVVSMSGDFVVKANSMENTTIAGTDYNMGLVGRLDAHTSTTVHGLSGSSVDGWNVAGSDSTGGRISGVRVMKAQDEVMNYGGVKGNVVYMSQGSYRDLFSLQSAALRYDDPYTMEIGGGVQQKGTTFRKSRRNPPGYVFVESKDAFKKLDVMPKPDNNFSFGDAIRMENKSGYIFPVDLLAALVCTNRKALYNFSGITEQ